jgi:hypothetical protein
MKGRDGDEQAAYAVAALLQRDDRSGSLSGFLKPNLTAEERGIARIEGWIWAWFNHWRQVNVRVVSTDMAIEESVDLAKEIFYRVFRRVPEKIREDRLL